MIVTETKKAILELEKEEVDILKEALEILEEISDTINEDRDIDYYAYNKDMTLFGDIYDAINNIQDYVSVE